MKQFCVWMCVLITAWAGAVSAQGVKVTTAEDFDKAMKTISSNARAVPKLLESGAFGEVKSRYVAMREQFVGVEAFWAAHKIDDAATLARNAIANVDTIIKAADKSDKPGID